MYVSSVPVADRMRLEMAVERGGLPPRVELAYRVEELEERVEDYLAIIGPRVTVVMR